MSSYDTDKANKVRVIPTPSAPGVVGGIGAVRAAINENAKKEAENNSVHVKNMSENLHRNNNNNNSNGNTMAEINSNTGPGNINEKNNFNKSMSHINMCNASSYRRECFTGNTSNYLSHPNIERYKQEYSKSAFLRQVVASSMGTCVSVLTLNPISVLKLRLQRQDIFMETSVKGAFRTIYKKDGILGFWAGSRIGLLQSLPSSVIYMTIYEKLKTELAQNNSGNFPSLIPGIAGGLARFYSATIIAPIEIIKTIQTGGRKESAITIAKYIYQNSGVMGFYKGWSSTILRDVPFSFIYWVSYERLKIFYKSIFDYESDFNVLEKLYMNIGTVSSDENMKLNSSARDTVIGGGGGGDKNLLTPPEYSIFLTFLSGSTSGVLAALATHPFDVLKTQQQLQTSEQIIKSSHLNNMNMCNFNYINNFNTIINNINNKDRGGCINKINNYIQYNNSKLPIKSRKTLINTEIFSSSNAYNVRMGVVEIEKMPQKNILLNYFRENIFFHNFGSYFSRENFCKKFVPVEKDGLGRIFRERGIQGLYKGLTMRLLTVIPSSAIMVTVYEFVKKMDF